MKRVVILSALLLASAASGDDTFQGLTVNEWSRRAMDLDQTQRQDAYSALAKFASSSNNEAEKLLAQNILMRRLDPDNGEKEDSTLAKLIDLVGKLPNRNATAVQKALLKILNKDGYLTARMAATKYFTSNPADDDVYQAFFSIIQGAKCEHDKRDNLIESTNQPLWNTVARTLVQIFYTDGFKDQNGKPACCLPGGDCSMDDPKTAPVWITRVTFSACPDEEANVMFSGGYKNPHLDNKERRRINLSVDCRSFDSLAELIQSLDRLQKKSPAMGPLLEFALDLSVARAADLGDPAELKKLNYLTALNLSGRKLDCQALSVIGGLARVRQLYISDLNVDDAAFACFVAASKEHQRLQLLDIARCDKLGSLSFAAVGQLNYLAKLRLIGTKISDADLKYLSNLKYLTDLNLAGTSISDAGVAYLPQSLVWLDLHRAQIGNQGIATLAHFEKLRFLDLSYNFINDEGIACALCAADPFHSMNELYLNGNSNSFSFELHQALKNLLCCRTPPGCLYDIYFTPVVSPVPAGKK